MAEHQRHAAWHPEAYAVYAIHATRRVLVGERQTFLDAFDFAAEYLDERDPQRAGTVPALEIVAGGPGGETIWQYSSDDPPPSYDPISRWGFVQWEGPRRAR